ncbi:MAG: hypothetical protein QOD00_1667 [Blastocatellia bacterium]|jgi:hypothetical protein|nr:hypothetical protein [Blastocatellia bacterium]
MPGSKSLRRAGPGGAANHQAGRKAPHKPKPEKPRPPGKPPVDQFFAEPPIVVTSGSVEIEMDTSIFAPDPDHPNKFKNDNRNLTSIEIQDLSVPPKTLMTVDLKSLAGGKCRILIKYEK